MAARTKTCGSASWLTRGAVALLVLVAFVAGLGTARTAQSWRTPGDTSPDVGFARDMSQHHAQAVYLSMIVYRHSTLPELRVLAHQMVLAQQSEIGTMSGWLREWKASPTTDRPAMAWMRHGTTAAGPDGGMPGMASAAEIERLRTVRGRELDILYAQLMIRHHLGGVHMVDGVLKTGPRAEVIELATAMRNAQQREITELSKVLTQLGATAI